MGERESAPAAPAKGLRAAVLRATAVVLVLFTLVEVNFPRLTPQGELALFALLGTVVAFLTLPLAARWRERRWSRGLDVALALLAVVCYGYVAVQSEPAFSRWWSGGASLGDRAGVETRLDVWIGILGLVLVLEAARRAVGAALPLLSLAFLAYGYFGPSLPSWLFPHRGYGLERLAGQAFLHSQGVFGIALRVMFTYVFLFVVYGAVLEATGATRFVIDWARRIFRGSTGAPAKVAVVSSGVMGAISGSAVANTATIGTFTIPLMRASGFPAHVAAGIEAAASSGGALVPPVMGAGAYMMLELVDPPVTFVQVAKAAILPAILYYLAIFLVVHLQSRRHARTVAAEGEPPALDPVAGVVFFGSLVSLVGFLVAGYTVSRAVTLALVVTLGLAALSPRTRIGPRRALQAMAASARGAVPLVTAAASVGIVVGVVTLTGVGTAFPAALLPLAQTSLFLALLLLMTSSIVLGMGLPSAVCYLLLATLVGPALSGLGVVPLAAHFFIFYFGLMSMVTPPVALAAYTAASIAGSGILRTSFTAWGYASVGFALPFVFVYRPQLLTLKPDGSPASLPSILLAGAVVAVGTVPLAAGLVGHLRNRLGPLARGLLLLSAVALFLPASWGFFGDWPISIVNVGGLVLFLAVAAVDRRASPPPSP